MYDDEIEELTQQDRFDRRRHSMLTRCQCDESWGACPGPNSCPHSGVEQDEEN